MTFETSPSAIDGARLNSALVRRSTFAGVNGANGIVLAGDLAVAALGTPGVGIQIAPGVGLVRNGYQTTPNEIYTVSNPDVHTVPAGSMPASNPAAKSYIVAVVIGDPAFSQTGHPFMAPTDPPAGTETTFAYVRVVLVEVPSGSTSIPGATYPNLPLARIDYPASTTTVTNAMITDLRKLAQPRSDQLLLVNNYAGDWDHGDAIPSGTFYADWGTWKPSIAIPSWARRMIVRMDLVGITLKDSTKNVSGGVRLMIGTTAGPAIGFDLPTGGGATAWQRVNLSSAMSLDCSSMAGTNVVVKPQGFENTPTTPTAAQVFRLIGNSQGIIDVRFFEQ